MLLLLTAVFLCSGAAGLLYESIWSRYLGLFVGHSADAQVIVLVIFLGGMSLGAAVAARRSARIADPLRWYAAIELAVGGYGVAFHALFTRATAFAYTTLFPAVAGTGALAPTKWLLAGLLILPPSLLLGATFPLMSAAVLRRRPSRADDAAAAPGGSPGGVLALLYFANSLGAAIGVLVAGFWLIERVGLPGTLLAAGLLNGLAALGSWAVLRSEAEEATAPVAPAAERRGAARAAEAGDTGRDARLWRVLLAVSFGTAVASFCYEIGWVRLLSLVLGSATHAFELMLSAFILGLALGALAVRRRADRTADPVRLLGLVQFAMGTLAILTLGVALRSFEWMAALADAVARTDGGYRLYNVARYGIALAVMLPPTFCAGMTLPLITRTLLGDGHGERAIGAVYAWNTFGSILGVILAALLLMPLLGVRGVLILGGAVDLALGCWLLWRGAGASPARRQTATLASVAAAALVVTTALGPAFDPGLLASGVFRYGRAPAPGARPMAFYRDGRTASVSLRVLDDSTKTLATNGKPDASLTPVWTRPVPPDSLREALGSDEATQLLLPLITLAHAPGARHAAVIGFGSGMSAHALLGSDRLASLVTIDIEPLMVEASRRFWPANRRVYEDPRSRIVHDDAKSYFAASPMRYDLILSEPSNPWVSGVAGLFTDEFYRRVRGTLAPGGVFGQWLHLYEIDDALVLSVLAALHRNFPSYAIHFTNDSDLLIVASLAPVLPTPDWSVTTRPGIAADLARFRPLTRDVLASTLVATRAELAPVLDGGAVPVNSDYAPVLDLGAERTRFLKRSAVGMTALSAERFDLAAAIGGRAVALADATRPALKHARVTAQALARALRAGEALPPTDADPANRALQRARLRAERLAQGIATGRPPVDWYGWFVEMLAVEQDRHLGTMGRVDSAWYAEIERYMTRTGAPADGIAAVRFLRAAVTYEWPAAAHEVPTLLVAWNGGKRWLPAGLFLQAATLARLRTGDVAGAREVLGVIWPATGWEGDDLRVRMLQGVIATTAASTAPNAPR